MLSQHANLKTLTRTTVHKDGIEGKQESSGIKTYPNSGVHIHTESVAPQRGLRGYCVDFKQVRSSLLNPGIT